MWMTVKLPIAISLISAVATNSSFGAFSYEINGFVDHPENEPIDGLLYQNYAMQNCSLKMIYFTQTNQPNTEIQVSLIFDYKTESRETLDVTHQLISGLQWIFLAITDNR